MKTIFKLIFILILGIAITNSAFAGIEEKETKGFTYYVYTPATYNSSRQYPLIIALHWSTGRGPEMIERWKEQADKKNYIVACPNSKDLDHWDTDEDVDIFRMLEEIKKDYPIDSSRVFLMGFSGGAMFAYYLGINYPERFRAVTTFAGSLRRLTNAPLSTDSSKHTPFFILHGTNDNLVDIGESKYAKEQLESYGYEVKYLEIGGLDHNYPSNVSWNIINWFEKFK